MERLLFVVIQNEFRLRKVNETLQTDCIIHRKFLFLILNHQEIFPKLYYFQQISGEAEIGKKDRLSQSKRHFSDDLSNSKDQHNVGDKLAAELEEEGADMNYDGAAADIDWKLDYIDDRGINNKFNIQPVNNKNIGSKKNKHWFDFYRNRRHVQNSKMQIANANEKVPEDEETAIKRHIKKLTTDELELLLKSLSDEKRILLQSIIDSDENVNKREITKKAAAEEEDENKMVIEAGSRQSKLAVQETESDATQKNSVMMTAKTLETRSVDINENEDKIDDVAEVMDSDYDLNENAMLQSAKAESKRDARDEYDAQSDPDDDNENVGSNSDRRISNRRLHKRTADTREDSLRESLEESFAKNLNLDSEMVPLIRVKRTHDNGQNYTRNNISRIEVEKDNELYINEANEANNITLPSQLQASLVSAEGDNVLDSIEISEPEIAYPINDESPEIKNWNLINCSCENVSFEIPVNPPDESRKSGKGILNHPVHSAVEGQKHVRPITQDLTVIGNNSTEGVSMYHDSELVDPVTKTTGLQRYKRIRRTKQTKNN